MPSADDLTPVMKQYKAFKDKHPDGILLFQMGDFYEAFFDDAVVMAKQLDIILTSRGKARGGPIPMAGIPFHASGSYLPRLTNAGIRVVLCDQKGAAAARGIVERQITRILTPGTLTDEILLDAKTENRIAAFVVVKKTLGVAWMSLTTHRMNLFEAKPVDLIDELARIGPSETLVPDALADSIPDEYRPNRLPDWYFDGKEAKNVLTKHFNVFDLSGFGCESMNAGLVAAAALLLYIRSTQQQNVEFIDRLQIEPVETLLRINPASRRNLEISETLRGRPAPTLVSLLDRCQSPMGSRFLRNALHNPTRNRSSIEARLDAVDWLLETGYDGVTVRYSAFKQALAEMADIERISARIGLATARPTDLSGLRQSLSCLPSLAARMEASGCDLLERFHAEFTEPVEAEALLKKAIADVPSSYIKDGGVIRDGFSEELDRYRAIASAADDFAVKLEARERDRTGIRTLKVEFNQVHGFYIEVSRANLTKVPDDYHRRQTLKDRERFTTVELIEHERQRAVAVEKALRLEKTLYEEILCRLAPSVDRLQAIAFALAEFDMLCAFAETAKKNRYTRPSFVDDSRIEIKAGRHPVIEGQLTDFVANDAVLSDERRLALLTGPNMGGKSTYMRQIALIVLMAYCGAFVPADQAIVGPVDQIFTRVGASDDMAAGKSTFMVEMSEAASILNNATANSLVLIDEIGRGTSTFDGLSLAWAIAAALATQNGSMTLFATHYFELTALPADIPRIINLHVSAAERQQSIVFLHRVEEGPASRSYGLQVAALAGVSPAVLSIARKKLAELEKQAHLTHLQPDLFQAAPSEALSPSTPEVETEPDPAVEKFDRLVATIAAIDPDDLTPKSALDALYRLKRLVDEL